MSLQNLQADFIEALLTDNQTLDSVSLPERISIYRNNFFSTLGNALKETYPLIRKLVGNDFFMMAAKEYIHHYPSRSGDLNEYGEYFSDFLIEYPPVKNLVYLPDVALFEWYCHTVYHGPDHPGLDISLLKDISAEQYDILHMSLHPAARLIHSHYPILKIVELCNEELTNEVDLQHGQSYLIITRREFDVSLISLTEGEFTFLSNIYEGYSLLDALNEALVIDPSFELEAKLPEWVQKKIIVDCF